MPTMPSSWVRWVVSTRTHGEVLTTEASVTGLEIRLLGLPEGFSRDEVEGWIASLAAAAREGAVAASPEDPIPPVLRHALGGLLFSHAELWAQSQADPCSVVLVHEHGRIAFGWVGEASVEIYEDGQRIVPEWVSVRDHQGREAHAWSGDEKRDVRIELARATGTPSGESAVLMEAHWTSTGDDVAAGAAAPASEWAEAGHDAPVAADEPAAAPTPDAEPETGSSRPSSGVARWLAQYLGIGRGGAGAAEPAVAARPATPEETPATEATTAATAMVGPMMPPALSAAPIGAVPLERVETLPSGVPEQIPPTPEPPALSARAIREGFATEDPRAISLPKDEMTLGAAAAPPSTDLAVSRPPIEQLPAEAPADASGEAAARDRVPADVALPAGDDPAARRPAPPRRPAWPAAVAVQPPRSWKRWARGSVFVLALFGAGWMLGASQGSIGSGEKPSPLIAFLHGIGLAGARFETMVSSRPDGAQIAVDGKDLGLRTPATIELSPGEHRVDLAFPGLGSSSFMVKGAKGDKVPLDAALWGSVVVAASDPGTPVTVAVDGERRGFAPLRLDSLAPGPHELRFTGPGMASWGTTVEVRVGESREVLAYPLQSPATGLLQVRATETTDGESQPLSGARVWVDGEPRGVTPLTLELPRGPHSVRVAYQQEDSPVQVIDLPGGNQRFSTFEFGLGTELPRLVLRAPPQIPVEEPVLISATLTQVPATDVREMWLHVRTPDNRWRRYPMTLLEAQGSAVGAAPFPVVLLGSEGTTRYYVSVLTAQGDEHYTELQTVQAARPRR